MRQQYDPGYGSTPRKTCFTMPGHRQGQCISGLRVVAASRTWRGFMLRTACAIAALLVGMCCSDPVAAQSPPWPNMPPPPWEQGMAFSFVGVVDTVDGKQLTVISDRDMGIWLPKGKKFTFALTPQTAIKDTDGPLVACAPVTVTFRDKDKVHIAEHVWVRPDPMTDVDHLVSDQTACAQRRGAPTARQARAADPVPTTPVQPRTEPDRTRVKGIEIPAQPSSPVVPATPSTTPSTTELSIGPAGRRPVEPTSPENVQRAEAYLNQYKQLASTNPEAALAKLNEAIALYP